MIGTHSTFARSKYLLQVKDTEVPNTADKISCTKMSDTKQEKATQPN